MEKISLTVEQWMELRQQSPDVVGQIPVWLQVTGCSMLPFVRPYRDHVMIVAVEAGQLRVGDIVLFPGKYLGGDYCLHRLYRIEGDRVQTFGDGNLRPDHWQPKSQILGKSLFIRRGWLTIDCQSSRWQKAFRLWGQAAAPTPRAVTALPSDEQTAYCPTAHRSQKNGKINV